MDGGGEIELADSKYLKQDFDGDDDMLLEIAHARLSGAGSA